MKRTFLVLIGMLSFLVLPLFSGDKNVIVKIGPALSFGNLKELSAAALVSSVFPGVEMAVRCAKRIELWGSYKFSKTETRIGHGYDDLFRLDAFAAGLRYKPFRLQNGEPFFGIGLDYYHFGDDLEGDGFTYFILPMKSTVGPYVQAGTYVRVLKAVQVQFFFKYNLVKHTLKRTTQWGTYHYRTDFSGLEFGLGILFCIYGK